MKKLIKLIPFILLIIIGVWLFIIDHFRFALIFLLSGAIGTIIILFLSKKDKQSNNLISLDKSILSVLIFVIIYQGIAYFLFNKKFSWIDSLSGIIFLIIIYLIFRFIIPRVEAIR